MKIFFGMNILLLVLGAANGEGTATHTGRDASAAADYHAVPHHDLDEQIYDEEDENMTTNLRGGGQGHRNLGTTITFDNFEDGWGNFKTIANPDDDKDAVRVTNSNQEEWIYQGNGALRIRDNKGRDSSVYHKESHDVTGYAALKVSFWFSPRSIGDGGRFYLEYSPDDGISSSWIVVKEYIKKSSSGSGSGSGFDFGGLFGEHRKMEDCSSCGVKYNDYERMVFKKNNIKYEECGVILEKGDKYKFTEKARFRFRSDVGGDGDMVYLDKVAFKGLDAAPKKYECEVK